LLNGKEVYLKSDVLDSSANAIKFTDIRLQFTAENSYDQNLLDSLLKTTHIKLTHMGHSQYRCDEKFFMVPHQPQTIDYSYANDANGAPLRTNNVFKKIKSGDILLSPYTLWKFQVVNRYGNTVHFYRFYGKTKLSLTGQAQFVKLGNPICRQKSLESIYLLDDTTTAK
jgi:hypothetical protein